MGRQLNRFFTVIVSLSLAITSLAGIQPATAATSCSSARQLVAASASSSGDISLAAKAARMCDNPCDSIWSFYQTTNLSASLDAVVLDAYRSCIAANAGGGSNGGSNGGDNGGGGAVDPAPCKVKNFTKIGKPTISGPLKTGYSVLIKPGTWSPKPTSFSVALYLNGKKYMSQPDGFNLVLTTNELGKKLSLKVTARRDCFKTATVGSASTLAVTRGSLPKFKSSMLKQEFLQDEEGAGDSNYITLNLRSGATTEYYVSGPTWVWVGHSGEEWANEKRGSISVSLPTSRFHHAGGLDFSACTNGMAYKIGVTMVVGVPNKYEPVKVTFPAKDFVCHSTSAWNGTTPVY